MSKEIPNWAKAENPWEAAKEIDIPGDFYEWEENLDKGVNFFVLTLRELGAKTISSCEGHPKGFYILFESTPELAQNIAGAGYFLVEILRRNIKTPPPKGKYNWRMHFPHETEKAHNKMDYPLIWVAKAWQRDLWDIVNGEFE